jgi:tetratricopeptide (TPR) repeat protein
MTAKECIAQLDWDSAIGAASKKIDASGNNATVDDYLYRGIARCFKADDKESKHAGAIKDLSRAISLYPSSAEARYYRAFAYWLDSNYERAIADCRRCNKPERNELLGKIYTSMSKYHEAQREYAKAVRRYKPPNLPPPLLLCEYIESCKNMNNR